ncbi:hypothetical protein Btru_037901 [Bulinus truncatus]|nr:hypothetical protein Btru_037901 [Bulinus truncatus]
MSQLNPTKLVVVLDGGTGTSLAEMGHTFIHGDPLWASAVIVKHPDDLVKLHRDFFLAGADVVLSASYQSSIEGFKKRFTISETEAVDLIKKSVELVKLAKNNAEQTTGRRGYVAASVGPYGATLCDRSEYHGRYADSMSKQELQTWHLPRLKILIDSNPDILAIETIPVLHEAEAILDGLKSFPVSKAWVTFQCQDSNHTAHGENIQDAVRSVAQYDSVAAVGVNCVNPAHVTPLLHCISQLGVNIPIIVKPNARPYELGSRSTDEYKMSEHVKEWLEAGATWIGGCCHVQPSDVAELRDALALETCVRFLNNEENLV